MKVIDISRGAAGAYCAEMLRLIGGDVLRVAVKGTMVPVLPTDLDSDEVLACFVNRGKRTNPTLMELPRDREALATLIASTDCLVEDWGPEGLEQAGLDEAELRSRAARLVITRISEFGETGPWAGWTGSELVNLAAGGMLFLTGTWDRPPVQLAPYQAQLTTGLLAAIATAAAAYAGGPATIDFSKQEAVTALVTTALTEYAYQGTVPAREGKVAGMARIERALDDWVYAGPASPGSADYGRYGAFLNIPEFSEPRFSTVEQRMEHWQEHGELLRPVLRAKTARTWVDEAAKAHLTFGLVQSSRDLLDCEVLSEREFFSETRALGRDAQAPLAPYLVDGKRPPDLADVQSAVQAHDLG
jgi:benzylsuccinate CoA-transferase BbsE subunit